MTSMRERMHVVLWALLILFLLSMTIGGLVGGANIIDQIFGRINPADAIGVVDGTTITPDEFIRAVNLRVEQYRSSGQDPDERLLHNIRNEVWENYIQDILVYQKIDEIGLTATDEEVLHHLRNNPPQFLLQDPTFLTDGVFDPAKYEQAINNPQGNEWVEIEQFMKNTYIPNYKLQQYIASSVVVTNDEVYNQYIKDNVDYTIEGIHVVGRKLQDEVAQPTDDELYTYYIEHLDEYNKDETRNIRYASWKKSPENIDTTRVYEEALEIINKANSGSSFAKLADQWTEDPSNQVTPDSGRGGNLGWFGKGQMVPTFDEAAFSARAGEIVGPVLSRFGYHIIKVHETRQTDGKDEINASHILLKINMGSQTRESLRRNATRFSYDAQDFGFDAALDTHQIAPQKADNLEALSISVRGIGFLRDIVQFAFNDQTEIGTVSDRLENDNFYVVAVLDSIIPEGTSQFENVKEAISRTFTINKQKSAALVLAADVKSKVDNGASLTDLVSDDSRLELVSTDKKKLSRGFNSIGRSYGIIGALMNSDVGKVVGPLETARGYAVIRLLGVAPVDSTDFQKKEVNIQTSLTNNAQQDAFDTWLTKLIEGAEIIDNRKYYY